jgi:superfamily II DNA/RNA helicase
MPDKIRKLALNILHQPEEINIAISKPPEKIVQEAFVVFEEQKIPLIKQLLSRKEFGSIIIFCSRKQNVKQLTHDLKRARFSVEEIHSDLEQEKREQVLMDFKNKKLKMLVATDILSRGIDIEDIDLVINYDVPNDGEDYIHRIGRTARAATDGTAYTIVSEKEQRKFARIEEVLGKPVLKAEIPADLGPVPEYTPKTSRPGGGKRPQGKKRSGSGGGPRNNKPGGDRGPRPNNGQPQQHRSRNNSGGKPAPQQ